VVVPCGGPWRCDDAKAAGGVCESQVLRCWPRWSSTVRALASELWPGQKGKQSWRTGRLPASLSLAQRMVEGEKRVRSLPLALQARLAFSRRTADGIPLAQVHFGCTDLDGARAFDVTTLLQPDEFKACSAWRCRHTDRFDLRGTCNQRLAIALTEEMLQTRQSAARTVLSAAPGHGPFPNFRPHFVMAVMRPLASTVAFSRAQMCGPECGAAVPS